MPGYFSSPFLPLLPLSLQLNEVIELCRAGALTFAPLPSTEEGTVERSRCQERASAMKLTIFKPPSIIMSIIIMVEHLQTFLPKYKPDQVRQMGDAL